VGTSINDALGLDVGAALSVSPIRLPLAGFSPALVVWGAVETEEFKRQSREFASALAVAGTRCETAEIPERNHFDVILDLADASTWLGEQTLRLFEPN
jgi:arylformamidase